MSPGDKAPPPPCPLAMTDSQLRMAALLQGPELAAAGQGVVQRRCQAATLSQPSWRQRQVWSRLSRAGSFRKEMMCRSCGDGGEHQHWDPPALGDRPQPHTPPSSPPQGRRWTAATSCPSSPPCRLLRSHWGCGEGMWGSRWPQGKHHPHPASPPPTATPAASASWRRGVPEHGDSWGVQRRQRGVLEVGRRGPGPGPPAAPPRGRPQGSHGEAGPGCKQGPPPSHVVLASRGQEGCQSPSLRCCCL